MLSFFPFLGPRLEGGLVSKRGYGRAFHQQGGGTSPFFQLKHDGDLTSKMLWAFFSNSGANFGPKTNRVLKMEKIKKIFLFSLKKNKKKTRPFSRGKKKAGVFRGGPAVFHTAGNLFSTPRRGARPACRALPSRFSQICFREPDFLDSWGEILFFLRTRFHRLSIVVTRGAGGFLIFFQGEFLVAGAEGRTFSLFRSPGKGPAVCGCGSFSFFFTFARGFGRSCRPARAVFLGR